MTISLSGQITNGTVSDVSNIKPFGTLKLNDTFSTDAVSATISFLTVNGTLSGTWLSSGVTSGANITYTLSATNPAQLQQELNALVFSPTPHQVAVNTTVQTHFTLNISAGLAGAGLTPSQTFQFGTSNSLVVDASGNMYTTNATGNNVNEYSAAGLLLNQLSPTNGINNPQTLAIDASGDLFVANGGTSNTVTEYSSAGTLLRTLATGISSPSNLATDASGDVFVANNGNTNLVEINHVVYTPTLTSGVTPTPVNNFWENTGQLVLSKALFTAFAGANVVTDVNFSNATAAITPNDYLYYNASNGGVYYDANGSVSGPAVEIAVVGLTSHPTTLSLGDFTLVA